MDLDLLKSFVAVAEAGSFTRAGERVHRTQSTVSQQIRKLEGHLGRQLLNRDRAAGAVLPTEHGEALLVYARRLLAIAAEARDSMLDAVDVVRLGVPEDFAGHRLTDLLAGFARGHERIRLDTLSGLSADLETMLRRGTIDLALVKRRPAEAACLARWPERLVWVAGRQADIAVEPVPLAVFPHNCRYRTSAIEALEAVGKRWRIAYASQGLIGIQAAVASGLAISLLSEAAVLDDHRRLIATDGFPEPPASELALISGSGPMLSPVRLLAAFLESTLVREPIPRPGAAP